MRNRLKENGSALGTAVERLTSAVDASERADRRADFRVMTTLRMGSLTSSKGEWLCLVGNISSGGSMVSSSAELEVGDVVLLRLSNGRTVQGRVAWQGGGRLGLSFPEKVSLSEVLASRLPVAQQQRPPRFAANCDAQIAAQDEVRSASVIDISEGGLKVQTDALVGETVTVQVPGLAPLKGQVRWARDGEAGIAFDERLPFDTLSKWFCEQRGGIARAAGGVLGAITAMLPSTAAAAETKQDSTAQTYGSAEILDHVGIIIKAKPAAAGAPAETSSSSAGPDALVSTTTSVEGTSGSNKGPASNSGVVYQYN